MSERQTFERKSIGWVLNRTRSCFAPLIERRLAAGESVGARVFSIEGQRFAQVMFADLAHADLIVALGSSS